MSKDKTRAVQRTLAECRRLGWTAQVVERWNQWSRTRHDLFGFIDVVALADGYILGIQATSVANQAARVTKITTECREAAERWRECGGRIEVWGWGQYKLSRGGKAVRWRVTRQEVGA